MSSSGSRSDEEVDPEYELALRIALERSKLRQAARAIEQSERKAFEKAKEAARLAKLRLQQDQAVQRLKGLVVVDSSSSNDDGSSSDESDDPPPADDGYSYFIKLDFDLLLAIMAALDIPNLVRSGAVCTSWRDAYNTFRLPALKQAPCLLYACDEYGPKEAALYCPSTSATFRVPFPGPPHEKRGFVFSCHGWGSAADEVGGPYLFNPATGVQAAVPPVNTIMVRVRGKNFYDHEGKHVFELDSDGENGDPKTDVL
uniref:F-box domain-containing protein n=1 Tax=Aegilops tauschii TaxID=37682 RepID=M8CJD2_AEGTA